MSDDSLPAKGDSLNADLALIAGLREAISLSPDPIAHYSPTAAKAIVSESGISHEDVARILGCSVHSVNGWVQGKHTPGPDHAENYQKLLGLLRCRNDVRNGQLRSRIDTLLASLRDEVAA